MRNQKKGKTGIVRIWNALGYSLSGMRSAWKDEQAFRQIFCLSVLGIMGSFVLGRDWVEYCLLLLPCFLAIKAELINTAIENAVDFTSLKLHPLAKKAKDMGSAIQLLVCLFWVLVWGGYFWMRFF